ncbi:MAG TPA: aminoacetone oxidase family FAD-binding enzyme [bacterium]|nr:aminoacetone oxidase family FAD-binding enzyme [bacterium]
MSGHDVIVLGGGAAGCMAAIQAGKRGRKVLLIDGGKRIGGKIPISGGGRCNFTNRNAKPDRFASANPRFAHSALAAFSAADTEAWIGAAGIPYHEKKLGQLFCDRSALDVVGLLEKDLREAGVAVKLHAKVEGLDQAAGGFRAFGPGWEETAAKAVVALGGPSYPLLGATDLALRFAKQLGLAVQDTAPALDGFVWNEEDAQRFEGLQGLALDVRMSCGGKSFDEALLFTHRGLSGPAALQASLYWRPGEAVKIDWRPEMDLEASLLHTKVNSGYLNFENWLGLAQGAGLPRRLAERWSDLYSLGTGPVFNLGEKALRKAAERLKQWTFVPAGTVGWHKAEVMRGGVDTAELNQKTMETKKYPGLYFIGEAVDVTGQLGGYNFQWAFASGFVCGQAV